MSSIFLDNGKQVAVTRVTALPLTVTQVKDSVVQVAFGTKKKRNKEFSLTASSAPALGASVKIDEVFSVGDQVRVTGITKGRGFAGVIKRYGFQRQPVTGGQSDRVRAPGAIGAQTPGKVVKGKKMPGHYGHVQKTISGLKILAIDSEKNQLVLSGSVPGPTKSWLIIQKRK